MCSKSGVLRRPQMGVTDMGVFRPVLPSRSRVQASRVILNFLVATLK